MAFEENKHPRDKNGQFTSKGNDGAGSSSTKKEKKIYSYNDLEKDLESKGIKGHTSTLYKEAKRGLGNLKRVKEISGGWWKNINPEEIYELVQKVNDEEIEKIEIDGDYERAVGPANDEEIEKNEKDVWENWEEWDDYDAGKTHGYATIDDYNRANEIIDELDTINKKWKNDDRELLKTWQNKSLTDEEYNTKNDELYKKTNEKKAILKKELDEITTRADKFKKQYNERKKAKDEKERKQAYKLFNLPF